MLHEGCMQEHVLSLLLLLSAASQCWRAWQLCMHVCDALAWGGALSLARRRWGVIRMFSCAMYGGVREQNLEASIVWGWPRAQSRCVCSREGRTRVQVLGGIVWLHALSSALRASGACMQARSKSKAAEGEAAVAGGKRTAQGPAPTVGGQKRPKTLLQQLFHDDGGGAVVPETYLCRSVGARGFLS